MKTRKCKTPDTVYNWGLSGRNTLQIDVIFPFDVNDYYAGVLTIVESDAKLRRYDKQWDERVRIDDLLHDCLEAFCADAYNRLGKGVPAFERPPRTIEEWWRKTFPGAKSLRQTKKADPK